MLSVVWGINFTALDAAKGYHLINIISYALYVFKNFHVKILT
jgi:hypothetical protein